MEVTACNGKAVQVAEAQEKARKPLVWVCALLFMAGLALGGSAVFLFAPGGGPDALSGVVIRGEANEDPPGWAESIVMQAIRSIGTTYGAYGEWDFVLHRYPGTPSKCRVQFSAKTPQGIEERFTLYVDLP